MTSSTTSTGTIIMLSYAFMVNAFLASGIVAVAAGVVGYFLVLRGEVFAGHALSHVGFAGATGAVIHRPHDATQALGVACRRGVRDGEWGGAAFARALRCGSTRDAGPEAGAFMIRRDAHGVAPLSPSSARHRPGSR